MRGIVLILVAVIAATSALAGQNGRGPKGDRGPQSRGESNRVEVVVGSAGISVTVQQTIRGYYQAKPKSARGLPPGLAKKYTRGKPLPPGIAKRYLPSDLQARLPVHPGHEYIVVDSDVLLIAVATGIVVEILVDVL